MKLFHSNEEHDEFDFSQFLDSSKEDKFKKLLEFEKACQQQAAGKQKIIKKK